MHYRLWHTSGEVLKSFEIEVVTTQCSIGFSLQVGRLTNKDRAIMELEDDDRSADRHSFPPFNKDLVRSKSLGTICVL